MIIVVEPHADDAFLSLGQHLEDWAPYQLIYIITVYSGNPRRAEEAYRYARKIGVQWVGMGYNEAGGYRRAVPAPIESGKIAELINQIVARRPHDVLFPLALTHPEHKEVFSHRVPGSHFYLDMPYAMVQKNKDAVQQALQGSRVWSFRKPTARKWRHVPIFKTQSKFFYYNPPEKLRETFELIVDKEE
jgi:hypothetical protein